ncbi:MAG: UvrD-helicase domain-containing protein [Candidatus Riflebacteria bacterium]|nr:UvrD-helicase domain-containing protein [Candidatus Riflebacteria bacterium]
MNRELQKAMASLNERQKQAVEITEGPLLIIAGAGSGKTRALTVRIAKLIDSGVPAYRILGVTFTNKAAGEMRQRVDALLPGSGQSVTLSTFHSFCAMLLRRWANRLDYPNSFTIYDQDDQEKLLREIVKKAGIDVKKHPPSMFLNMISQAKNDLIEPKDFRSSPVNQDLELEIYAQYQKKLHENGAMDFDDLLFNAWRLISTQPDVLSQLQEKYTHFLVDEYQDTNFSQYKLIALLSKKSGNLCVVGDEDQSIYGWRGATIRNIQEFEKDFPGAQTVVLDQNYRSTQKILDAASDLIAKNSGNRKKRLWSELSEGESIDFLFGEDDRIEADLVTREIEKLCFNQQFPFSSIAVLFRTNSQTRALEQALSRKAIPYDVTGGLKFFARREVKDVLAFLRVMANPRDEVSLRRIVNVPTRGIGEATIEKLIAEGPGLWEGLKRRANTSKPGKAGDFFEKLEEWHSLSVELKLFDLANLIVTEIDYLAYLREDDPETSDDRISNIDSLLSDMKAQEENDPEMCLQKYLEQAALHADVDDMNEFSDRVHLMTIHNAKGLEFPVVFIMGMEEGLFPHRSSFNDPTELEEERRLAYVGITRAMKKLVLSAAKRRMVFGNWSFNPLSRFIGEIPAGLFGQKKPPQSAFQVGPKREPEIFSKFSPIGGIIGKSTSTTGRTIPAANIQKASPANINNVKPGVQVYHDVFGIGRVLKTEGSDFSSFSYQVEFQKVGIKKFLLQYGNLRVINIENQKEV